MLTEEQQSVELTASAKTAWVALLCISRLAENGSFKDYELSTVGEARDALKQALIDTVEVDFDVARAQQQAMQQQRIAEARAAQQKAQEEAAAAAAAAAEANAAVAEAEAEVAPEAVSPADVAEAQVVDEAASVVTPTPPAGAEVSLS